MEDRMTSGPITKRILMFAMPILAGQILQQLYNLVDSIIVGRFVGVSGLAAVGATWSLTYIVCYFCIGTCTGMSIPLSQAYGAGNLFGMRCYFINGVYISIILAFLMTTVTSLSSMLLLKWLQTPDDIIQDAHIYLLTMFLGLPFTILYNFCFGVLMAFGDSKKSSIFMFLSTILNLFFDLFTIIVLHWGVFGAAISTIVSQAIAGFCSLFYILKKHKDLIPKKQEWNFQPDYVSNIIRMSVPMGLQYSITAIGAILLQCSVNQLGSDAVAGFSAGSKVKSFCLCPLNALGTALSSFTGQNFGAGKIRRIQKGLKSTICIGLIYSIVIIILMLFVSDKLAMIFVSSEQTQVISYVREFIIYISFFQLELAILFAVRYCVQGMGYGKYSIYSGLAEMAGRSLIAIFLVPIFGFHAVCWNEGVTFLAGILVIVPVYFILMKQLKRNTSA